VGGASITNDGSGQTPVQALANVFIGLTPAYAATNNVVINPGGAVSGYPSRTWFFNSASGTFPWNDPAHGDYTLTSKYRSSDICISAPGDCTTDGKSAGVDLGALEVAQAVDTACTFSVSPTFATVPAVGGTVTFEIAASGPTCSWTAKSNVPWLKVVEGATGVGSGSARFSGDANEGSLRSASVTVAGRSISVQQVGYESGRASGLSGVSAVRGRSRVE